MPAAPEAAQEAPAAATGGAARAGRSPAEQAGDQGAARSALVVMIAIALSRLVGLVRQRASAHFFGTSIEADALTAALRIGNIAQNLLGEGTLSATFIPVYARLRREGAEGRARHFALSALGLLAAAVAVLSVLCVLAAPWLAALLVGGLAERPLELTTRAVRVLFPMTGLLVVAAWGLGVLNAHRRFFVPYAAPVLWSVAQIAALYAFGSWLGWRGEALMMALAWSALAGAALQLLVLLPSSRRLLGSLRPRFDAKSPEVREAARKLPAALLGRGIIQISGLIDTYLASTLGHGAMSALGYAQTIYLLPMALLGTGEAAVQLPEMAGMASEGDRGRRDAMLRDRLGDSTARLSVLAVPCASALLFFGGDVLRVLLETGRFDRDATARVQPLLACYGAALLGNGFGRLFATTAFATGDTKTPALFAVVRVVVSTAIALVLMRPLGVLGIVAGATVAGWVEAALLAVRIRRAIGGLGFGRLPLARLAVLTASCVATGLALRYALGPALASSLPGALLVLAAFTATFAAAAHLLGLVRLRSLLFFRRGRG